MAKTKRRIFKKRLGKYSKKSGWTQFQHATDALVRYKSINSNYCKKVFTFTSNLILTTTGLIIAGSGTSELQCIPAIIASNSWTNLVYPAGASGVKSVFDTVSLRGIKVSYFPNPVAAGLSTVNPTNGNTPISYFECALFPDYLTGTTNQYLVAIQDDKKFFQQNLTVPQSVYWNVNKQVISSTTGYPALSANPIDTASANTNSTNYPGIIALSGPATVQTTQIVVGVLSIDFFCMLANMG